MSDRIRQAADLLRAEAEELALERDSRYSTAVLQGRVTSLYTLTARIAVLQFLSSQILDVT